MKIERLKKLTFWLTWSEIMIGSLHFDCEFLLEKKTDDDDSKIGTESKSISQRMSSIWIWRSPKVHIGKGMFGSGLRY
jgi:hypothetical protein